MQTSSLFINKEPTPLPISQSASLWVSPRNIKVVIYASKYSTQFSQVTYHSGIFMQDNPRLSNKISLIFASFVHLLATKPMAKWSKESGQSLGGLCVKNRAEI